MTKQQQKYLKKEFNHWLTELENNIENVRQKELTSLALQFTGEALGYVKLAFYLDIIDTTEFEILHDKFYDYYTYYYNLHFYKHID